MSFNLAAPGNPALVLFLSDNLDLADRLGPVLYTQGIDLHTVRSTNELTACLGTLGPSLDGQESALVLVDSESLSDPEDLTALASSLHAEDRPPLDLVYLAPPTDVRYRLAAFRASLNDCLDADSEPVDLATQLAARLEAAEAQPARILIVDDQPVAALVAARVLEAAGMRTERVSDPMAVLEAVQRFEPNLVLMDLHMPGVTGIELTAIIRGRERFSNLPIVFLSAELDPHRQLDALRLGGDDFLAKPVEPSQLVSTVRARLKRFRRAARHPPPGLAPRELLLKALDRQIQTGTIEDWATIYLECPKDGRDLTGPAAAIRPLLESEDLAARVGDRGIAVLARREGDAGLAALAESLGMAVHRGLRQGRLNADELDSLDSSDIGLGVGWCPLTASGGAGVTLISRARHAARISLRDAAGLPVAYTRETEVSTDATLRNPIVAAIFAGRLQLLYQPIVALRGAMVERYEATPRLHALDGELLPPALIGPLARRAGLSDRVDCWMLEAGLDALRLCRATGRSVELFIHRSLGTATDEGWVDRIRDGIAARDLIWLRPVIQLQLQDADLQLELAARRARQLVRLGVRLCLNGLVDGERGARVLDALPIAYVRLASTVLRNLPLNRLNEMVSRIQGRGAQVIATGVDGPKAIERIYRARIDLMQGPYVQPPMEAMDFDFLGTEGSR